VFYIPSGSCLCVEWHLRRRVRRRDRPSPVRMTFNAKERVHGNSHACLFSLVPHTQSWMNAIWLCHFIRRLCCFAILAWAQRQRRSLDSVLLPRKWLLDVLDHAHAAQYEWIDIEQIAQLCFSVLDIVRAAAGTRSEFEAVLVGLHPEPQQRLYTIQPTLTRPFGAPSSITCEAIFSSFVYDL
jgi:hypothetical protein